MKRLQTNVNTFIWGGTKTRVVLWKAAIDWCSLLADWASLAQQEPCSTAAPSGRQVPGEGVMGASGLSTAAFKLETRWQKKKKNRGLEVDIWFAGGFPAMQLSSLLYDAKSLDSWKISVTLQKPYELKKEFVFQLEINFNHLCWWFSCSTFGLISLLFYYLYHIMVLFTVCESLRHFIGMDFH